MSEFKKQRELQKLDRLRLGDVEGGYQEIDAGGHGAIANVVVKLNTGDEPYLPGVELSKRIVALPQMIEALKTIRKSVAESTASIYDFGTLARDALLAAGIES